MLNLIIKFFKVPQYLNDSMQSFFFKKKMKKCGKNVNLRPSSSVYYGLGNLSVGDSVSIPNFAHIFCTEAPLKIGNNVIFGPSPTIVTGNHRIDVIGKFISDSHEKAAENDKEVNIEDDVWVGANVTILMGVTIGRGSVVAAGAVVSKSCPPYSIIGGVPAKLLKYRFSIDEIIEHELNLYPLDKRFLRKDLVLVRG